MHLVCGSSSGKGKEMSGYNPVCEVVYEDFPTCLEFLIGWMDEPPKMCCNYVKKLNWIAKHGMGPSQICWCIEYMVRGNQPRMIPSRIDDLQIKCATHLSFPISEYMDCDKV
ncbi:hypothetical protein Tsubulata_050043 [Turnera subulata]|uniref:Bifunctional inhibitor/plant lipid transfer protein/seed storage helical domain-containing protein n=1 Tax=Turnera subulata TaxID=218843 RepID=A0A9Q0JF62_9ROSI|nr:hypothetical protein Tsubulata_050043 [Turnera subulata]